MNALWNGTPSDYLDLMRILARNCDCEYGFTGVRLAPCSAHKVVDDQPALNGLLYGRRLAARFCAEEWMTEARARSA